MTVVDSPATDAPITERRLLVTVRLGDSDTEDPRPYQAVGMLICSSDGFSFSYLPQVQRDGAYATIAGFGDVTRTYHSDTLFPAFAQRVMSARRPDRARFLEAIDLAEESEPWEILSRSGGRRGGDTIEVMEEPIVDSTGSTVSTFLVHGVRYQDPSATERIQHLHPGDGLALRLEPQNPVNARAVLVTAVDDVALGWVPDPLVEFVNEVMQHPHDVRVVRANGPDVSPHLRLLVRLTGKIAPDNRPFGP